MPETTESELWDGKRMAWLLGITGRRLRQLVEEGVIDPANVHQGKRVIRRYDPVKVTRVYYEYLLRSRRAPTTEDQEESKQRYESARADLWEAKALIAQHAHDVETGKLIYVKDVQEDLQTFFVAFKTFALNLPMRTVSRLEGLVDSAELRKLEQEIRADIVDKLREFCAGPVRNVDVDDE